MLNYTIIIAAAVLIMLMAIPYVAYIRHPTQRPLAAYFIFISVFAVTAALLFKLMTWFAANNDMNAALGDTGPALLFIFLDILPAAALATWLARKPPWKQQGPPD